MDRHYTLQTLLNEIKEDIKPFKEGMVFETLKSIYPDAKVSKEIKNIRYKGKAFTKPLANTNPKATPMISSRIFFMSPGLKFHYNWN